MIFCLFFFVFLVISAVASTSATKRKFDEIDKVYESDDESSLASLSVHDEYSFEHILSLSDGTHLIPAKFTRGGSKYSLWEDQTVFEGLNIHRIMAVPQQSILSSRFNESVLPMNVRKQFFMNWAQHHLSTYVSLARKNLERSMIGIDPEYEPIVTDFFKYILSRRYVDLNLFNYLIRINKDSNEELPSPEFIASRFRDFPTMEYLTAQDVYDAYEYGIRQTEGAFIVGTSMDVFGKRKLVRFGNPVVNLIIRQLKPPNNLSNSTMTLTTTRQVVNKKGVSGGNETDATTLVPLSYEDGTSLIAAYLTPNHPTSRKGADDDVPYDFYRNFFADKFMEKPVETIFDTRFQKIPSDVVLFWIRQISSDSKTQMYNEDEVNLLLGGESAEKVGELRDLNKYLKSRLWADYELFKKLVRINKGIEPMETPEKIAAHFRLNNPGMEYLTAQDVYDIYEVHIRMQAARSSWPKPKRVMYDLNGQRTIARFHHNSISARLEKLFINLITKEVSLMLPENTSTDEKHILTRIIRDKYDAKLSWIDFVDLVMNHFAYEVFSRYNFFSQLSREDIELEILTTLKIREGTDNMVYKLLNSKRDELDMHFGFLWFYKTLIQTNQKITNGIVTFRLIRLCISRLMALNIIPQDLYLIIKQFHGKHPEAYKNTYRDHWEMLSEYLESNNLKKRASAMYWARTIVAQAIPVIPYGSSQVRVRSSIGLKNAIIFVNGDKNL